MSYLRIHTVLLAFVVLAVSACASAGPKMKVLGVKAPQVQPFEKPSMKVFVEVHNPTSQDLNLQRLQYRLVAEQWFDSKGVVNVTRTINPGASAVVEISVPVSEFAGQGSMQGVPYTLDARLYALADKTQRSWKLTAKGALAAAQIAQIRPTQVADRH